MPAWRKAPAMTLAPRSWPSSPGLPIITRILRVDVVVGIAYSTTARTRPASTDWPSVTATSLTLPAFGEVISLSIFIASTTPTPCRAFTSSPATTSTRTIFPGIGATTRCSPSAPPAPSARRRRPRPAPPAPPPPPPRRLGRAPPPAPVDHGPQQAVMRADEQLARDAALHDLDVVAGASRIEQNERQRRLVDLAGVDHVLLAVDGHAVPALCPRHELDGDPAGLA